MQHVCRQVLFYYSLFADCAHVLVVSLMAVENLITVLVILDLSLNFEAKNFSLPVKRTFLCLKYYSLTVRCHSCEL